jgi:hypothetical protein
MKEGATKEELLEALEVLKTGGSAYTFVKAEKEADIYRKLDLLDYLEVVLEGMPIIVTRETQRVAQKLDKSCGENEGEKCQSDTWNCKIEATFDEKPKTVKKVAKKPKTAPKTIKKGQQEIPEEAIKLTKADPEARRDIKIDMGKLAALAKMGWTAEEIADDMLARPSVVQEKMSMLGRMIGWKNRGRSPEWVSENSEYSLQEAKEAFTAIEGQQRKRGRLA